MKFLNMFAAHVKSYPINKSLKYSYSLGFLISFLIVIQIVSGIFLSAFYVPYAQFASQSLDYIVNEVDFYSKLPSNYGGKSFYLTAIFVEDSSLMTKTIQELHLLTGFAPFGGM